MNSIFLGSLAILVSLVFYPVSSIANILEIASTPGSIATRYRVNTNTVGSIRGNDLQYAANLGFLAKGFNHFIEIGAEARTGRSYTLSFMNSGIGRNKNETVIDVRRAHFSILPIENLKISAGAMAPIEGMGSERTYLDSDGWVDGYRLEYKIWDIETHFTAGSIPGTSGQEKRLGFYRRFGNYNDLSFRQFGSIFKMGTDVKASLDYIYDFSRNHARGAFKWFPADGFLGGKNSGVQAENTFQFRWNASGASATSIKITRQWDLGSRALDTSFIWSYIDPLFILPIGDRVNYYQSIWLQVFCPKGFEVFEKNIEWFADYVQNFTYTEQRWFDLGVALRF